MEQQAEPQHLTDDELADRIDAIYAREALRTHEAAVATIAARQRQAAERAEARQRKKQAALDRAAREAQERLEEADRRLAERWATPAPLPPRTSEEIRERFHHRRMPYGVAPQAPVRSVAEQIAALAGDDAPDQQVAKQALERIAAQRTAELGAKMLNKGRDASTVPPVTS